MKEEGTLLWNYIFFTICVEEENGFDNFSYQVFAGSVE